MIAAVLRAVAGLPPPTADPEQQRRLAEAILSRQEFQRPEPSLVERIQEWIDRQISGAFDSVSGGGTGSIIGWVILLVAIALVVWLLVRNRRVLLSDPTVTAAVRIDAGRTPDEWRSTATGLEGEGRWKEALRCRYRALLGDLVRRGVVVDVPGRTAGEYRAEVTSTCPAASDPVAAATALFELAWYADQPTGAGESTAFRAHAEATLDAVDGARGRPRDRVEATVGA